jgi:phosphoglucomutase
MQILYLEGFGTFTVNVINSVNDYTQMMEEIFDLSLIRRLIIGELTGKPFRVLIDCMNGATGPYVSQILGQIIGTNKDDLLRSIALQDFGGGHPDPNLTYANDLVERLAKGDHDFGAAFDGDGVCIYKWEVT